MIRDLDRIIEMAWEDRTTFEAIQHQFGLGEPEVIAIMRSALKPPPFECGASGQADVEPNTASPVDRRASEAAVVVPG